MPLLENLTTLKKYITVANGFVIEDITPFKRQALREYIKPFVGDLATELADPATGENATIKNEGRELLEEALACFSIYLGGPELALQITGTGFNVADTTDFKQATSAQKNDFARNLLRRGHSAIDELFILLEANKELFTSYTEELQDKKKEFLVDSTETFGKYFNIHNSRQTYLATLPTMRRVEDQYLKKFLCADFINVLKTTDISASENKKLVKETLQKAIVSLTVSKIVIEGQFILDQNGIYLKFDSLPHEKIATNSDAKINDFLLKTSAELLAAGQEYLKEVAKIITDNSGDFTECEGAILLENTSGSSSIQISVNNRILSL